MKNIVEALIIVTCAWLANVNTAHATPPVGCPWTGCNDPSWHMPMPPAPGPGQPAPGHPGPGPWQPAPGPIAGTGIAYLIIYAGYRAVRRWRGK